MSSAVPLPAVWWITIVSIFALPRLFLFGEGMSMTFGLATFFVAGFTLGLEAGRASAGAGPSNAQAATHQTSTASGRVVIAPFSFCRSGSPWRSLLRVFQDQHL